MATPGPSTLRYGGNTSCVELRTRAGTLIVFDCGTGARGPGSVAARSGGGPISGAMLLGHSHWDHIQGFPFFGPAFVPGNAFTIYAPTGGDKQLSEVLAGQMQYTYFPVRLDQLQAQIDFHDLGEDTFTIGDATVQAQYLNHTALTLGYRVTAGGVTVVYATDHEPNASSRLDERAERRPGTSAASRRSTPHPVPGRRRPGHPRRPVHRRRVRRAGRLGPQSDGVRGRRGRRGGREAAGALPP